MQDDNAGPVHPALSCFNNRGPIDFQNRQAPRPKVMEVVSKNSGAQPRPKCNTLYAVIFRHIDWSCILKDVSTNMEAEDLFEVKEPES